MKIAGNKLVRVFTAFVLISTLVACGLPRSGPNKKEIYRGSVSRGGNSYIVLVDDRVVLASRSVVSGGFPASFTSSGVVNVDTIQPGDRLSLTIWENVDNGLLAGLGQNATILEELQVDQNGNIFVPYAGRVKAQGSTPEGLRQKITARLREQTPDPQVEVRRAAGDGTTVNVMGSVGAQGVYPIEGATKLLSSMLSKAGGIVMEDPEVAKITVARGSQTGTIWYTDLLKNPSYDIALQGGDRIYVERDRRTYTALGATGSQSRVDFATPETSALEAIAQVGGLSSLTADPTGVFVFRNEPSYVASNVLNRNLPSGTYRVAYVLDLTKPNGMFVAREFQIRDGDTVYVTEAPFVQWQKMISALTGSANGIESLTAIGN